MIRYSVSHPPQPSHSLPCTVSKWFDVDKYRDLEIYVRPRHSPCECMLICTSLRCTQPGLYFATDSMGARAPSVTYTTQPALEKSYSGSSMRYGRSRSFKVTEIRINQKLVCDSLLVFHCNCVPRTLSSPIYNDSFARKSAFFVVLRNPVSFETIATSQGVFPGRLGPDVCFKASVSDTIFKTAIVRHLEFSKSRVYVTWPLSPCYSASPRSTSQKSLLLSYGQSIFNTEQSVILNDKTIQISISSRSCHRFPNLLLRTKFHQN